MLKSKTNISLNGSWKFFPDPTGNMVIEQVQSQLKASTASNMIVPSNWEMEGLHNFSGSVWFCKEFTLNTGDNELSILRFSGIDYFTDVWLNGTFIGKHEGYFQPFFFDITNLFGENNQLIVKVTSPYEEPGKVWPLKKKAIKGIFNHHDCRPGGWDYEKGQDKNTGGIWNDVELLTGYPVYIHNTKITSKLNSDYSKVTLLFEIEYYYNNATPLSSTIELSINSPSGEIIKKNQLIIFQSNKKNATVVVQVENPELWWSWDLGEPALYNITISADVFETQQFNFGIREVNLDEKQQFFLNGKRLFLRGTNIIPEQFLSKLTSDRIKSMVGMIKEANINIVRVHAHVNRHELYQEFDKQGILLWQDFALQWTYEDSPEFMSNAVNQIKDMVNLLYNYSSICFWCCHNEPGEQIHTLDHFLRQAVQSKDQSRIIRTASNYEEHPYDGWYWGNKEHFAAAPMGPLVTEFGAQALPCLETLNKIFSKNELFPPDIVKWQYHNFQPDQTFNIAKVKQGSSIEEFVNNSQNYQAELLKTAVEFYRRKRFNNITGIFQFMFIDCWPSITWSVVDYFGKKKPGYEILKKVYAPLFISINVRQNQYYPGKKLLLDLYIINDLDKDFRDCSLVFFLDGKEAEFFRNINIEKDSIYFINYEKINIDLPEQILPGDHIVSIKLLQKNIPAAESSFSLSIV